ncbi:MAG: hypothetical protein WAL59_33740 [Roseiarcus sp.]
MHTESQSHVRRRLRHVEVRPILRGDRGGVGDASDLINLATKDDVCAVKDELKRLEGKIEASKSETLRWIVGAIGFQTIAMMGTVFGPVRFFVH